LSSAIVSWKALFIWNTSTARLYFATDNASLAAILTTRVYLKSILAGMWQGYAPEIQYDNIHDKGIWKLYLYGLLHYYLLVVLQVNKSSRHGDRAVPSRHFAENSQTMVTSRVLARVDR